MHGTEQVTCVKKKNQQQKKAALGCLSSSVLNSATGSWTDPFLTYLSENIMESHTAHKIMDRQTYICRNTFNVCTK